MDARKRLTAQQILEHPWMTVQSSPAVLQHVKKNMQSYNARRRFRSAIRAVQLTSLIKKHKFTGSPTSILDAVQSSNDEPDEDTEELVGGSNRSTMVGEEHSGRRPTTIPSTTTSAVVGSGAGAVGIAMSGNGSGESGGHPESAGLASASGDTVEGITNSTTTVTINSSSVGVKRNSATAVIGIAIPPPAAGVVSSSPQKR